MAHTVYIYIYGIQYTQTFSTKQSGFIGSVLQLHLLDMSNGALDHKKGAGEHVHKTSDLHTVKSTHV